jgi:hypothetical protein
VAKILRGGRNKKGISFRPGTNENLFLSRAFVNEFEVARVSRVELGSNGHAIQCLLSSFRLVNRAFCEQRNGLFV